MHLFILKISTPTWQGWPKSGFKKKKPGDFFVFFGVLLCFIGFFCFFGFLNLTRIFHEFWPFFAIKVTIWEVKVVLSQDMGIKYRYLWYRIPWKTYYDGLFFTLNVSILDIWLVVLAKMRQKLSILLVLLTNLKK